ncbi:unnamed protein product, partial [Allacma fusca]
STSHPEVQATIPEEMRETSSGLTLDKEATTKALGLIWNPTEDDFRFSHRSTLSGSSRSGCHTPESQPSRPLAASAIHQTALLATVAE